MIHIQPLVGPGTSVYNAANTKPMVLYRNLLADGTLTASSEAVDGFAENAVDGVTYDYWTPTGAPATLTVTLSAAQSADCAYIDAHTISGGTVYIERLSGTWQTVAQDVVAAGEPALFIFPEVSATQWRIRMTQVASIGVAMIGKRLVFPTGVNAGYTPINLARNIERSASTSLGGQYLGTRIWRKGASTSASIASLSRGFIETDMAEFNLHYDEGKPFVWASSPSRMTQDHAYCWPSDGGRSIAPEFGSGGLYADIDLDVEAFVEQ